MTNLEKIIYSANMSNNIHQTAIFTNPVSEPLPHLIAESIRQAIQKGRLKPGEQLPSEPQFAMQLKVSRTTLRDAVRILEGEGVLERRRGVGTFVVNDPLIHIEEGLETLFSTTELLHNKGYTPGTSFSRWETMPATEFLAPMLEVSPGAPLLHLSRTRTANGIPVIHCEEYLPARLFSPEEFDEPMGDWSFYEVLERTRIGIVSAVCKLAPVVADQSLAAQLNVPVHHPLLLLRQIHYTHDHQPILYCENYHNSSVIEFHVIRRR